MKRFKNSIANSWTNIAQLSSPQKPIARKLSRLVVLESVWNKEIGDMAVFWRLCAVKGGTIYVRIETSAARQELDFRESVLVKSLNKYFTRKWIKRIRAI